MFKHTFSLNKKIVRDYIIAGVRYNIGNKLFLTGKHALLGGPECGDYQILRNLNVDNDNIVIAELNEDALICLNQKYKGANIYFGDFNDAIKFNAWSGKIIHSWNDYCECPNSLMIKNLREAFHTHMCDNGLLTVTITNGRNHNGSYPEFDHLLMEEKTKGNGPVIGRVKAISSLIGDCYVDTAIAYRNNNANMITFSCFKKVNNKEFSPRVIFRLLNDGSKEKLKE